MTSFQSRFDELELAVSLNSTNFSLKSYMIAELQDNPLLFDFNVDARVNDFIAAAMVQVKMLISFL